jgi:hypothetical protein
VFYRELSICRNKFRDSILDYHLQRGLVFEFVVQDFPTSFEKAPSARETMVQRFKAAILPTA